MCSGQASHMRAPLHAPLVQVLRGYVGDRNARPVFAGSNPFEGEQGVSSRQLAPWCWCALPD